ncbi:Glycoside hydrolase family 43 protein [Tolypocladium paradoxum]|uniref:Glycoside hydrolase family 43 protein n=1 Tax=Tolypocladium paradoxum TaxID=94208 RepID=A0A2S4KV50_9HYPO|nr:Glycoside hydrolase family 43 protein [Tolypocladium paradoxum]
MPKPSSSAKRKRDTKDNGEGSDKENDHAARPAEASKRKQVRTADSAKPKKMTAGGTNKEVKRLYTDTLKALDKGVDELDKKVKVMSGNSTAITTSNYATSAREHMGAVKKLVAMDTTLAFNLLLSMADASHTDLDTTCNMCGTPCDDSIPTFKLLDAALLPLIEAREKPASLAAELAKVPQRWASKDADVGVFKTGRPNKQQLGQMYRQKLAWEKNRRQARRNRREETEDWVKVALSDLVEERDYLYAYGVKEYLPTCIAKLEELVRMRRE